MLVKSNTDFVQCSELGCGCGRCGCECGCVWIWIKMVNEICWISLSFLHMDKWLMKSTGSPYPALYMCVGVVLLISLEEERHGD